MHAWRDETQMDGCCSLAGEYGRYWGRNGREGGSPRMRGINEREIERGAHGQGKKARRGEAGQGRAGKGVGEEVEHG